MGTHEDIIERVRQRARKNFSMGYNCSEAVFEALWGECDLGLPPDALRLATGFGGGIGLYGDTCGALTGAVLAVSAVHGRRALPEGEGREVATKSKEQFYGRPGIYRLFNQLPNRIAEKYGSTLCRDLTRKWQDEWLCREHALSCRELITDAAGFAAELLLSEDTEAMNRPFGRNVENLVDAES
jgi:C_GCAxxG_C_C family probable redox protein